MSSGFPSPAFSLLGWWATATCFVGMVSILPAQTTEWVYHKTADGLHPDGNEQQMVWLMNRARANPAAEGLFLADSGDSDISAGIDYFSVNTTLLKTEFVAIAAKPPAAFDRRLYEASRVHSLDLIARDAQDHNNQLTRVTAAGFAYVSARVSVFAYASSSLETHGALNIDWGPGGLGGMQAGRGHRAAIMSQQTAFLSNVGFAAVPEVNRVTNVGPLVFSGAYCSAGNLTRDHYNRFLVGTVWTDSNANTRYDPGEGLNNVLVQPDRGTFHAVTGVGGGWAIPINSADTYNLTLSGNTLGGGLARSATVGTESVLLDIKVIPGLPAMSISFRVEGNGNILLNWSGGRAPYQVQQTTNLGEAWTDLGGTTSSTTASIKRDGPINFYRVISTR